MHKKNSNMTLMLSILMISYNTKGMTVKSIKSILNKTLNIEFELIVVDNNSSDGSAESIEALFPQVQLVKLSENIGFGRANNLAGEQARGEFLLLLNPDTLILDNAIERLVEFAGQYPEAGIWGGRTVFEDGSLNPASCWNYMTIWSLFCQAIGLKALFPKSEFFSPESFGGWTRNSVRSVDVVSGCFLLIGKKLWDNLGGFDPQFFMYAEEVDLCFRAKSVGASPIVTPTATIVHYGGASEQIEAEKVVKLFTGKMTFINQHWSSARRGLAGYLFRAHTLVRLVGFWLASSVLGRSTYAPRANIWGHVWRCRHEWMQGWPPQPDQRNL